MPAIDDELIETDPELLSLPKLTSSELVAIVAVLVKLCGKAATAVTRTGTLTLTEPPLENVPKLQVKDVDPDTPVQVLVVIDPVITDAVGVPTSCIPAGRVSDRTVLSASASNAPVLLRTTIV